jgi:hypothetical protein
MILFLTTFIVNNFITSNINIDAITILKTKGGQRMTPKEKAEDLFTTFRYALSHKDAPLGIINS